MNGWAPWQAGTACVIVLICIVDGGISPGWRVWLGVEGWAGGSAGQAVGHAQCKWREGDLVTINYGIGYVNKAHPSPVVMFLSGQSNIRQCGGFRGWHSFRVRWSCICNMPSSQASCAGVKGGGSICCSGCLVSL